MVYTEGTERSESNRAEAFEPASTIVVSLKFESGEDAGHKKLCCHFHRRPFKMDTSGKFG